MDLIDDEDAALALVEGNAGLLVERADVVDRVVARRIQLPDVDVGVGVKGGAAVAGVAGLVVGRPVRTVKYFGQDSRRGRLAYAPWSAKKEGVGEVVGLQGILQGLGYVLLANDFIEANGTVFSGGDDEVAHGCEDNTRPGMVAILIRESTFFSGHKSYGGAYLFCCFTPFVSTCGLAHFVKGQSIVTSLFRKTALKNYRNSLNLRILEAFI